MRTLSNLVAERPLKSWTVCPARSTRTRHPSSTYESAGQVLPTASHRLGDRPAIGDLAVPGCNLRSTGALNSFSISKRILLIQCPAKRPEIWSRASRAPSSGARRSFGPSAFGPMPGSAPDVPNGEALGEGVGIVEHVLREPRDPRPAQRRHDRRAVADRRLFDQAAHEASAQDPLVDEVRSVPS
jgi:hypothetical protein